MEPIDHGAEPTSPGFSHNLNTKTRPPLNLPRVDQHQHIDRRTFLAGATATAASLALYDPVFAAAARRSRHPAARNVSFGQGLASGEPSPNGITLWTRVDGLERKARVQLEIARDDDFRRVVYRPRAGRRAAAELLAEEADQQPANPQAGPRVLLPLRRARRQRRRGRPLPHGAARPTRASRCGSASSPASTSRRATTPRTPGWPPRTTSTWSSASATTSTSATRPTADRPCGATAPAATTARSARSPSTAPSTRSTTPTRTCARCARSSRCCRSGTTTRSRTTTPARSRRPATRTTSRAASAHAYRAYFEAMPYRPPARQHAHLRALPGGRQRGGVPARRAPVPLEAALRRRARAVPARGARRPVADDARPGPARVVQVGAGRLARDAGRSAPTR